MSEIHPVMVEEWYLDAKKLLEYEPEATLWDLFRYKMLEEHREDIDRVVEEDLIICEDCGEEKELHALDMCEKCYKKHLMRKRRANEVK